MRHVGGETMRSSERQIRCPANESPMMAMEIGRGQAGGVESTGCVLVCGGLWSWQVIYREDCQCQFSHLDLVEAGLDWSGGRDGTL